MAKGMILLAGAMVVVVAGLAMAAGARAEPQRRRATPAPLVQARPRDGIAGRDVGRATVHGTVGGPLVKSEGLTGGTVKRHW